MPFDQMFDPFLRSVKPEIWNKWKDKYNDRIDEGKNIEWHSLTEDVRAIFFRRKTILKLILRLGINLKKDFVVFRFISKEKSHLNVTPCIMSENSCDIKYASEKIGHLIKGEKDQSIPKDANFSFYEQRLKCVKKYTEFKDDTQGIAHPVMDFVKWFLKNPLKREFAIIFLYDDSSAFNDNIPITRKMNLGFISTDIIPLDMDNTIDLRPVVQNDLYDQGSSCCPPLK